MNKYLEKIAGLPISNASPRQIAEGISRKAMKLLSTNQLPKVESYLAKMQGIGKKNKDRLNLIRHEVNKTELSDLINKMKS